MEWTRPQIWLAAFLTLGVYSYLVKENPWYRFAEHTFVGLAVGHGVTMSIHQTLIPYTKTHVIEDGRWWFVLLVPIGLMYYTRYFWDGKYGWLSSYPICLSMGWDLGYDLARGYRSTIVQLADTMVNLKKFDDLLFFAIWVCAMMYFFFTVGKESKTIATCGKIGRYFMMLRFGAAFANTIQGRISLFLGRLSFLLTDWLKIKA